MKKKAIFTIMIGDNPIFQKVRKNFDWYAKKCKADLIICDQPKLSKSIQFSSSSKAIIACLEKFQISNLLDQYEQILYLDADILITPHALNIFEYYDDPSYIYMFNEGLYCSRKTAINEITQTMNDPQFQWPTKWMRLKYYNAGVIIISKEQQSFFKMIHFEDFKRIQLVDMFEQSYLNYLLLKHHYPIHSISHHFNRMESFGVGIFRFRSYFIHYAGGGYGNGKPREQIYLRDYKKIFNQ